MRTRYVTATAPQHARKLLAMCFLATSTSAAFALSKEAAIEHCKMTVGKPIVISCMRASGGLASLKPRLAKATPPVRACVIAALNAANGRANVAVAIPTEVAQQPTGGPRFLHALSLRLAPFPISLRSSTVKSLI